MFVILPIIAMTLPGCSCADVGQGELGRIRTGSGWADKLYKPGKWFVGPLSRMYRLDTTEDTYEEKMQILTADNINLTCTVEMRAGLNTTNKKGLLDIFNKVKADRSGFINREDIYRVYGKMILRSKPRELLGALKIDDIRKERGELGIKLDKAVRSELANTPLSVTSVKITNIDWPELITQAMEEKKKREIEIEAEKAKIQKAMVAAEGRRQVAEEEAKIKLIEAKMVADYNKTIADSLKKNPEFLSWHRIKMLSEAAQGPNNAFIIIPYESMTNGESRQLMNNILLKQMLKKQKK